MFELLFLIPNDHSSLDLDSLSMSVVALDSVSSGPKHTQCDINLDNTSTTSNVSTDITNSESRTTRSAPPSPTPVRKKKSFQNVPWNKAWSKMTNDEHTNAVECLTRIVNDEMGLREQLEIIRIINPDTKLSPSDTQFVIGKLNSFIIILNISLSLSN
jgi:hypothetical protein